MCLVVPLALLGRGIGGICWYFEWCLLAWVALIFCIGLKILLDSFRLLIWPCFSQLCSISLYVSAVQVHTFRGVSEQCVALAVALAVTSLLEIHPPDASHTRFVCGSYAFFIMDQDCRPKPAWAGISSGGMIQRSSM